MTAASAFIARRGKGRTVIAGYPWFLDWGRDTFISARGLLAAGMVTEVVDLLVSFGEFVENGTMPNTINGGNASNRDTSDAPLWYAVVCQEAAVITGNDLYQTRVDKSGRTITGVLREIAIGYARGTPNGIRMDPASGLIWSPPHFTWMDTNYPACTPREGYPIEIQISSGFSCCGNSNTVLALRLASNRGPRSLTAPKNLCANYSGWGRKATSPISSSRSPVNRR